MSSRYQSADVDPSPLGKPLHFVFSNRTIPNRFLKGAMAESLSSWSPKDIHSRGVPSANLVNVYRRWGSGGVGLLVTGNIMIDYVHFESKGNPVIARDAGFEGERFERFKEIAEAARKEGSVVLGQISHAGRQVSDAINKHPISASDVELKVSFGTTNFAKPRAATLEDIRDITGAFTHAAVYLEKAGFDGVQLHGAHGFLLAQFLSKTTNLRTDAYGGSLTNRARLIVDIAQSIRRATSPSFILGIKINSQEWQADGFQAEEAAELVRILEENTFDFVELSGGTLEAFGFHYSRESTRKREAFFLEFAEKIVPGLTKTRVYVTGGFKTVGAMVQALDVVDGVGLGRSLCQEPGLCRDILEGKVMGAIEQKLDPNEFGPTLIAAGVHIRQMGKGEEPTDFGVQANVDAFLRDVGDWTQRLADDKEGKEYGYPDLTTVGA